MERVPLVRELADLENDTEFEDHMEALDCDQVQQPARSKKWLRTAAVIFVLGAVATVIAAGPVHNQVVTYAGHPEQMWGFSDAWDTVKNTAGQGYNAVKDTVAAHWPSIQGFLDSNVSEETKLYLSGKLESLKGSGAWAQAQAQNALCGMKPDLGQLKERLAQKMAHDFYDPSSACHVDFQSMACRQACVDDACKDVPTLHGGTSTEIAGISFDKILNAPKNLCAVVFTEIVTHIQSKLVAEGAIQQAAQSEPDLKSSIDAQMGEVDAEFAKVC